MKKLLLSVLVASLFVGNSLNALDAQLEAISKGLSAKSAAEYAKLTDEAEQIKFLQPKLDAKVAADKAAADAKAKADADKAAADAKAKADADAKAAADKAAADAKAKADADAKAAADKAAADAKAKADADAKAAADAAAKEGRIAKLVKYAKEHKLYTGLAVAGVAIIVAGGTAAAIYWEQVQQLLGLKTAEAEIDPAAAE